MRLCYTNCRSFDRFDNFSYIFLNKSYRNTNQLWIEHICVPALHDYMLFCGLRNENMASTASIVSCAQAFPKTMLPLLLLLQAAAVGLSHVFFRPMLLWFHVYARMYCVYTRIYFVCRFESVASTRVNIFSTERVCGATHSIHHMNTHTHTP